MVIPITVLVFLNFKLIQVLKIANNERAALTAHQTSKSQHRDNLTLTLVIVVSVYILCNFPDFALRIIIALKGYMSFNLSITRMNVVTNTLLAMNSSTNVVIYCIVGRRFRGLLRDLISNPIETFRNRKRRQSHAFGSMYTSGRHASVIQMNTYAAHDVRKKSMATMV